MRKEFRSINIRISCDVGGIYNINSFSLKCSVS